MQTIIEFRQSDWDDLSMFVSRHIVWGITSILPSVEEVCKLERILSNGSLELCHHLSSALNFFVENLHLLAHSRASYSQISIIIFTHFIHSHFHHVKLSVKTFYLCISFTRNARLNERAIKILLLIFSCLWNQKKLYH